MIQIDFLQTSSTSKSADAITARFSVPGSLRPAVVVVDAGYTSAAEKIAEHVTTWYQTDYVDAVVSTHPDADHLNGITSLFPLLRVGELLIHQPVLHGHRHDDADCDATQETVAAAQAASIPVAEPFQGLTRFRGALTVVGPSVEYYRQLLNEQVGPLAVVKHAEHLLAEVGSRVLTFARKQLSGAPAETLSDDAGGTSSRNNTSAIVSITADGHRVLLTGDAGVPALSRACDFMDATGLSASPLNVFQVPHHGSRHNLDAAILDRLLGPSSRVPFIRRDAVVSAAALDEKHPSPAVTNAVKRRAYEVYDVGKTATLGCNLSGPERNWPAATPEPWYDEEAASAAA